VNRWALVSVFVILGLCLTVDILDRNLKDPQVPALFYGAILSAGILGFDRWRRGRRSKLVE